MKTFNQLTKCQKEIAIEQATKIIKELTKDGIIDFGHGDELTNTNVAYYALAAAQGSYYSESGDRMIEGIVE